MAFTIADAHAHLKKHEPAMPDGAIAVHATEIFRRYGISRPSDVVSRPLVQMIRVGKRRNGSAKAHAVWEALRDLKLIPALPVEVAQQTHLKRARAAKHSGEYWHQRALQLERRLHGETSEEVKEIPMLTPAMLRYFGFERNPVYEEIQSEADIWWSSQHREEERILIDAVEGAKFVRIAGPRGTGKSLVAELVKRKLAKRDELIICEPGAALSGILTTSHLITTVIQALKRHADKREEVFPESHNPSRRYLAMLFLLKQAKRANRKVVLWIDEAHILKSETYLALKRFLDEVDGIGRRLLGIILIGQNPEAAYNPRARDLSEVTLRLQTFRIESMHDEMVKYLRFKIERAGGEAAKIITPSALNAIATRCAYPLDANALFAQLLVTAFANREKPIGREEVDELAPEAAGANES